MATIERNMALDALREPVGNPNAMDPEAFRLLVEGIREVGFLQPVLVRDRGGPNAEFEIVDGVHRVRAARAVGLTSVPAVVVEMDDRRAALLQIGMNRLRGELNLSEVARIIATLRLADPGLDDLTLSGFDDSEIDEMVRISGGHERDPVDDAFLGGGDDPSPAPKPFAIELRFDTREDLARVKRSLRKAAGKGTPLEVGLLRIIDGALASQQRKKREHNART